MGLEQPFQRQHRLQSVTILSPVRPASRMTLPAWNHLSPEAWGQGPGGWGRGRTVQRAVTIGVSRETRLGPTEGPGSCKGHLVHLPAPCLALGLWSLYRVVSLLTGLHSTLQGPEEQIPRASCPVSPAPQHARQASAHHSVRWHYFAHTTVLVHRPELVHMEKPVCCCYYYYHHILGIIVICLLCIWIPSFGSHFHTQ